MGQGFEQLLEVFTVTAREGLRFPSGSRRSHRGGENRTARSRLGPPRPALQFTTRPVPILDNASGEDFLYMHRRMIARLNEHLREIGDAAYLRVSGWTTIPAPDDADYPVPPPWFVPGDDGATTSLATVKSDEFFHERLRYWERQFTDPTYLRGLSVGELGARLEFTIHNQLHNRWSAQPYGDRPEPTPDLGTPQSIPIVWDDVRNDYLGDTYSSHVNSTFWRIHGWVDDRIEDWRFANAVFGDIVWTGTWEGKVPPAPSAPAPPPAEHHRHLVAAAPMHDGDHGGHGHDLAEMEHAAHLLGKCPGGYRFLSVLP